MQCTDITRALIEAWVYIAAISVGGVTAIICAYLAISWVYEKRQEHLKRKGSNW